MTSIPVLKGKPGRRTEAGKSKARRRALLLDMPIQRSRRIEGL